VDLTASKELARLFELMGQCEWSTSKMSKTSTPTVNELSVPFNRNGIANWTTKSKITFSLKRNENRTHWLMIENREELEISFGEEKLKKLKEAVVDIANGKGDFSISDETEENILTFWWRWKK
jgi:hypothetical protein